MFVIGDRGRRLILAVLHPLMETIRCPGCVALVLDHSDGDHYLTMSIALHSTTTCGPPFQRERVKRVTSLL